MVDLTYGKRGRHGLGGALGDGADHQAAAGAGIVVELCDGVSVPARGVLQRPQRPGAAIREGTLVLSK
jgi:hypothetical protein